MNFLMEVKVKTVNLCLSDGSLVTKVDTPLFVKMPEVIQWGARYFTRKTDTEYVEAYCWPAINLMPDPNGGDIWQPPRA